MSKKMKTLSREEILAAQDLKTKLIDVPEWGGSVRIKEMTIKQRGDYIDLSKYETETDLVLLLLQMSIVDDDHQPLFTSDDLAALAEKKPAVIDRLAIEISRINGFEGASSEKN